MEEDDRLEGMISSNDLWKPSRWRHIHRGGKPSDDVGGLEWPGIWQGERRTMAVSSDEDMGCRGEVVCNVSLPVVFVCLPDKNIFSKDFSGGDGCLHEEGHQGRILLEQIMDCCGPFQLMRRQGRPSEWS